MVPDELNGAPLQGISTARKKKPKELAVITECCTAARVARLRGVLSGGRLHVLGAGRGQSAVRTHPDRPHPVHRV